MAQSGHSCRSSWSAAISLGASSKRAILSRTARPGLLRLLDDLLQLFLERLYGPLRGYVDLQRIIELLGHLQRHVRVVRRDRTRLGVLGGLLGQGYDRNLVCDLRVIVEALERRQVAAFERPLLHLLGGAEILDEGPGGVQLVLRGGVDEQVPPPEAAVALAALAGRDRRDVYLIRLYLGLLGVRKQPVNVGPVAHEDRVTVEEGRLRFG